MKTEAAIHQVPLFTSLPAREIKRLARAVQLKDIPAGALLVQEGEKGDRYYILVDGEVEILKALGTPDERLLGVRGPGSIIGEMSLFSEDGRHTASVRAKIPLQLLELNHADLDSLLHRQPRFAYEMMRTISQRLDESEHLTIADLRQKNVELQQAYDDLKAAQAEIIEKEKLEKELEVAREIQLSILPREFPQCPRLDFGARIVPMAAVGGDFYDFIALDDDRFGIAVGDVTDHGVPAALFMALTLTLLRAEAHRTVSPKNVLVEVNRLLLDMNEAGMFVTLIYGILDCKKNIFHYARAGHELPIVMNPRSKWENVDQAVGQPLGLFNEPLIDEQTIDLPSDSLLILYTDGVPNALDKQNQMFGLENFLAAISEKKEQPAQELCFQVLEIMDAFRGEEDPYDDVTLVAIKIS
ncbi:MAG: SpoIIE family protein phosphatase [Anaerolineales bacterium]|nr:SpoIIE family protein phosphatase [Anaerolineales bacterium]